MTCQLKGAQGFNGRRINCASNTSASRPIGIDPGYGATGLVGVSRCGLGGVDLLNKSVPRPLLCAWAFFLASKLTLPRDEPVGGGSWAEFGVGPRRADLRA